MKIAHLFRRVALTVAAALLGACLLGEMVAIPTEAMTMRAAIYALSVGSFAGCLALAGHYAPDLVRRLTRI